MTLRPRLIVCADDYALTPGVSRSIRELLAARRISATSVMAASPYWPDEAAALAAACGGGDIGLHLTLTDQTPLGEMPTFAADGRLPSMPSVYRAGALHRLPLGEIRAELDRQLARFIAVFGRPPAHIDGHHHVHQLPGVRELVVEMAKGLSPQPWVRLSRERTRLVWARGIGAAKATVIGAFGRDLERQLKASGIAANDGFAGAYDVVGETRPLAGLFERFLIGARENTLVMCHPGHSDALLAELDAMVAVRDREDAFLKSDEWATMIDRAGLEIGPLRRM